MFITKRHANWWQPNFISALAHYAQHRVEQQLQQAFGSSLRPEIGALNRLKQNLEEIGAAGYMLPDLHKLHDFDMSSIAQWRQDPSKADYIDFLLNKSKYRGRLKTFMAVHGYRHAELRLHHVMDQNWVVV